MIQKVVNPGGGFRGLLNYLLDSEKEPELVGGNTFGKDPRTLASEFGELRQERPDVEKPVFHASLSLSRGENLTNSQWNQVAKEYLERQGYADTYWVAIRHRDRDHDHLHILASRIDINGDRIKDFQERRRGEQIVRDLESKYGLEQVRSSKQADRAAMTRGELAAFERTGEVSPRARLQSHIDAASEDRPSVSTFLERLEAQGVSVEARIASTGRVNGITYSLPGELNSFKGSTLGGSYSWPGLLKKKGLDYDEGRDLEPLRRMSERSLSPEEPEIRPASPAHIEQLTPETSSPKPAPALVLREQVHQAARESRSVLEFFETLRAQGVEARPNLANTGHVSGLSFESHGTRHRGTDLGRNFTWQRIQKTYDLAWEGERDLPVLRDFLSRSTFEELQGSRGTAAPEFSNSGNRPSPGQIAGLYRQASELQALLTVDQQHQLSQLESRRLQDARDRAQAAQESLKSVLAKNRLLQTNLDHDLLGAYGAQNLTTARRRFEDLVRDQGGEGAARLLGEDPGLLGKLPGKGLGRFADSRRREALASLERARTTARDLVEISRALPSARDSATLAARTLLEIGKESQLQRARAEHLQAAAKSLGRRFAGEAMVYAAPVPVRNLVRGVSAVGRAGERGSLKPLASHVLHRLVPHQLNTVKNLAGAEPSQAVLQASLQILTKVVPAPAKPFALAAQVLARQIGSRGKGR